MKTPESITFWDFGIGRVHTTLRGMTRMIASERIFGICCPYEKGAISMQAPSSERSQNFCTGRQFMAPAMKLPTIQTTTKDAMKLTAKFIFLVEKIRLYSAKIDSLMKAMHPGYTKLLAHAT
jgi:hypothetical protein